MCILYSFILNGVDVVVVQSLNHVQLFTTPMDYSIPDSSVFHYLPELAQIHVQWTSDAI